MKQTAIEYLLMRIAFVNFRKNTDKITSDTADHDKKEYIELAKQLMKEQIELAYEAGVYDSKRGNDDSKRYYQETYEK